jgi:hypothetical protein
MHRLLVVTALALAPSVTPHLAIAQRAQTTVRVRVMDTTGAPVAGADVSILRGSDVVLGSGATDAGGIRQLSVPRGGDELEVVVRRLGYQRGDYFFRADRDSVPLAVRLRATVRELSPVQVTASQDLNTKRFHVSADDIAASKRPIRDGLDVVTKLRPDMMEPPGPGFFAACGLYYIWINGERIVFPPIDPGVAIQARQQRQAAQAIANPIAKRPAHYHGTATVPVNVQSVLAKIKPEHIEEMNYVDCRDNKSNDMPRGQNAVFVALKPGIGYDPVRGTYVVDAAARAALDLAIPTARNADAGAAQQLHQNRLLGVYDERTGEPVIDAHVVDVATGTFARTSSTGTVSLGFLPEGSWSLEIRRAGYADLKLNVAISPRDTMPLTLVLSPRP